MSPYCCRYLQSYCLSSHTYSLLLICNTISIKMQEHPSMAAAILYPPTIMSLYIVSCLSDYSWLLISYSVILATVVLVSFIGVCLLGGIRGGQLLDTLFIQTMYQVVAWRPACAHNRTHRTHTLVGVCPTALTAPVQLGPNYFCELIYEKTNVIELVYRLN